MVAARSEWSGDEYRLALRPLAAAPAGRPYELWWGEVSLGSQLSYHFLGHYATVGAARRDRPAGLEDECRITDAAGNEY